jgi:hypothetical protein
LTPTECKEPEKGQKEESGLSDLVLLLDLFHVGNPRQAQSSPVFPCRWPTNPTPKISAAPKKYRKPLPGFSYASRPSEAEKVQKKENPLPDLVPAPEPSHIANPREAQSGSVFPCSHTSKKETKPQDVPMAKEKHQNADGLDSMADIEHSNNPVEQQSSSPSQEQSAPAATHVEGEDMDTDEDMGEECEEEYHSDMDEDDVSDKASAMDEDDVALEEDEPMDTDAPLAAEIHEAMAIDLSQPVEAPQIPIITAPYKIEAVNVTTTNSHEVDMNENAGTEEASFVPKVVQPAPLRQGAAFRKWICEQLHPLVEALDEKMSHIPHLHNIRPNGDELKDLVLQRLFAFYFKNVSSEAGPYQACLANAQNNLALCSKAVTIHGHLPKNIPGLQDFVKRCNTAISHHFAKSLVLIEGDIPSNVISREVRSKQLLKLFNAITRANSRLAMLYASRGYANVHMTKFSSRFPSEESSATYKKMMDIAQNLEHQQALRALSKNTSFKENVYAEVYMENAVDDFDNVDTNLENHLDDIHKDDKSYSICKRDGGVSHLENILQREMWSPKLPQAYPLPFQNSSIDVAIRKATVNDLFMWISIAHSSWTIQHGYSLITNEDDIKSTALREERVILSKAVEELDKSIFTSDEKGNMNLSERSIVNQMNYWTILGKSSLDKYKSIKDHVERRFVTEPNEALKDIARDPNGSLRDNLISLYDRKRLKGTEPVVLPDAPLVSDTSEEEEAEQARSKSSSDLYINSNKLTTDTGCGSWIHTHMLKYAARFRGELYQKSYLDSKPWYKLESGKGELEYEEDDDEKWPEEYRA